MGRTARIGLTVVGIAAVIAVWFFFFFNPKSSRLDELDAEIEAAQVEEDQLTSRLRVLQDLSDNEPAFLNGLAAVEASIPANPDEASLIQSIFDLADEAEVNLPSISSGLPAEAEGDLFQIALTFSIEGPYFQVLGFLNGLEALERLIRIDSLNIGSSTSDEGATELNVAITARAFSGGPLSAPTVVLEPTTDEETEEE